MPANILEVKKVCTLQRVIGTNLDYGSDLPDLTNCTCSQMLKGNICELLDYMSQKETNK